MRIIVAGSRTITDYALVCRAIKESGLQVTELVSGAARGVDTLGEQWASTRHITVKRFPANWNLHGWSAGYRRNTEMAKYAEALVAIWDGRSRGTLHMIQTAEQYGLKIHVLETPGTWCKVHP